MKVLLTLTLLLSALILLDLRAQARTATETVALQSELIARLNRAHEYNTAALAQCDAIIAQFPEESLL